MPFSGNKKTLITKALKEKIKKKQDKESHNPE